MAMRLAATAVAGEEASAEAVIGVEVVVAAVVEVRQSLRHLLVRDSAIVEPNKMINVSSLQHRRL